MRADNGVRAIQTQEQLDQCQDAVEYVWEAFLYRDGVIKLSELVKEIEERCTLCRYGLDVERKEEIEKDFICRAGRIGEGNRLLRW